MGPLDLIQKCTRKPGIFGMNSKSPLQQWIIISGKVGPLPWLLGAWLSHPWAGLDGHWASHDGLHHWRSEPNQTQINPKMKSNKIKIVEAWCKWNGKQIKMKMKIKQDLILEIILLGATQGFDLGQVSYLLQWITQIGKDKNLEHHLNFATTQDIELRILQSTIENHSQRVLIFLEKRFSTWLSNIPHA